MWKISCAVVLLVQLIAAAKIGKLIGPIPSTGDEPLFGTVFTQKYAKIAREIVHNSSKLPHFDQIFFLFFFGYSN